MGNVGPYKPEYAGMTCKWTSCQLRQLFVKTFRQIGTCLTNVLFDKMIVVYQPFCGRRDGLSVCNSRANLAIGLQQSFVGHIYMGTIGLRGSYQAMKTGYVDEGWAREHHRNWYEDIREGKIPAQRGAPPPGRLEQPAA